MCANCALCNVPAHKSWCSVQCMNKRPTAHALKGRNDFLCSAVHALKKRSWSVQFMLRRLTAHAQKRSWCSLQCTVHICTTQYTILLFVPTDYCTQCACAEKKLVLTTVYCILVLYSTALCSYRLLYTQCACVERKEVFSLQVWWLFWSVMTTAILETSLPRRVPP